MGVYILGFFIIVIIVCAFMYKAVQYNKKRTEEYETVRESIKHTLRKYETIKQEIPDCTYLRKNLTSNISILNDVIEYNMALNLIIVDKFNVHQMKQIQYELAYTQFSKELVEFLDVMEYLFILIDITNHPYRTLLKQIFKNHRKADIIFHYIYIKN